MFFHIFLSVLQRFVSCRAPQSSASPSASPGFSVMRGRCSRKLGVLAKAGFLLWLLWLGYLLLERFSFPTSSSDEEEDDLLPRQLSIEDSEADGQLARPLYSKPSPDNNAPGEWGRATHLNLSPEEKKQEQDTVERYAINIYVSDKISLHRHIQDHRMTEWVEQKVIQNRKDPVVTYWLMWCDSLFTKIVFQQVTNYFFYCELILWGYSQNIQYMYSISSFEHCAELITVLQLRQG